MINNDSHILQSNKGDEKTDEKTSSNEDDEKTDENTLSNEEDEKTDEKIVALFFSRNHVFVLYESTDLHSDATDCLTKKWGSRCPRSRKLKLFECKKFDN